MILNGVGIDKPQEVNLLEKLVVDGNYVLKWKGKLIALPRADKAVELYYKNPIKSKIMVLRAAKELAIEQSKKTKGKIYINVDDEGNCSTSKTFAIESSVFCYHKGCQVALDAKQNFDSLTNETNSMKTATEKKSTKVAAKKESHKEKPEVKAGHKPEVKTGHKPVKSAKAEGVAKQLTSVEIIKLINSGAKVTTTGGKPHTVRFMKTVADKEKKRDVLVVK